MKKRLKLGLLALAAIGAVQGYAQDITFKGVYENNRWTDVGDEHSKLYLGSLKYVDDEGNPIETDYKGYSTIMSGDYPGFLTDPNGNVVFINLQDGGIYSMTWDGNTLTEPKNDPEIPTDFYKSVSWESYKHVTDVEKAVWVKELNAMKGNSGGVYANGKIYLINSRDEQSTVDEELFSVTSWDAETGECLSSKIYLPSQHVWSLPVWLTTLLTASFTDCSTLLSRICQTRSRTTPSSLPMRKAMQALKMLVMLSVPSISRQ